MFKIGRPIICVTDIPADHYDNMNIYTPWGTGVLVVLCYMDPTLSSWNNEETTSAQHCVPIETIIIRLNGTVTSYRDCLEILSKYMYFRTFPPLTKQIMMSRKETFCTNRTAIKMCYIKITSNTDWSHKTCEIKYISSHPPKAKTQVLHWHIF